MTVCTQPVFQFPSVKRRAVQGSFSGGHVTSDGGVPLLRQVDRRLGLTRALARALPDARRQASCAHSARELVCQRVFSLCLGYEDLNDQETLRHDLALQTAADTDRTLAHPWTLCRWENAAEREAAWALHAVLVEQFIASHTSAPSEIVLDFDATDDPVHGQQEGRFFHGYYDQYCFLPLYVFCGEQLLVAYLRPSNIDVARHAWAVLALLVKRLRQAWPAVKIILRADSGFCRWRMLRWCDRHGVGYVVGLAKNARINALAQPLIEQAAAQFAASGQKQRLFGEVRYAAGTWERERRVVVKAEHTAQGSNPRYVVTNLEEPAAELYDRRYCARGEMENRIKEQQLALFADRTSCHRWWANQFRLLLSAAAYTLLEALRRLGCVGTQWARAQCDTLRLRLLKIGAVVLRNTRRVRLLWSSGYPWAEEFGRVVAQLASG